MNGTTTRREFVAGAALACTTGCIHERSATSMNDLNGPERRSNILLIHADQHRFDCLGAYGNSDIRTPHIDSLADDGVRYDNSFCPYPVCTPSRYSLLTGLPVHQHRGWNNHCTLHPDIDTFPKILRQAGYNTKAVGKMHFTPTYLDVGFDEMVLSEQNGPGRWDDDYHRDLRDLNLVDQNDLEDQLGEYRRGARAEYWDTFGALPSNLPAKHHSTQWIGDHAVDTLESWGEAGHLLMVGFIKPHHPFDPPEEWCDAYDPEKLELLPGWTEQCLEHDLELGKGYLPSEDLTEKRLRRVMAYYYATIEHIDRQVGRMADVLKQKGQYDNTMIIYTSDHGDYMGFHHMILKGNYMYDPLVKVPLIIKYPGNRRKGQTSQILVSNIDLAPTIVRQAGCRAGSNMNGLNLDRSGETRDVVFAENKFGAHTMARTQTRKLIISTFKNRAFLYDLETDPCEIVNRYDDPAYQDDVAALTKAIKEWRDENVLPKDRHDFYLDEQAPQISQPNVPSLTDKHREDMISYYRNKMAEARPGK